MTADPVAALHDLVPVRVVFGHQSVGGNVLDGVRDWLGTSGVSWPIVEPAAAPHEGGALIHAAVGRNGDPRTKCADFLRLMEDATLGRVDVAVLKFCYVDVQDEVEAVALADEYRAELDELARRHPSTVVVPVTVPVTHVEGGLGVVVRELLGRPNVSKRMNLARQTFNDRVRHHWSGRPMFDLARAEATRANGQVETFTYQGRRAEHLFAAYSDDGRHLNAGGRRAVAAAFLRALADAVTARRSRAAAGPPPSV